MIYYIDAFFVEIYSHYSNIFHLFLEGGGEIESFFQENIGY